MLSKELHRYFYGFTAEEHMTLLEALEDALDTPHVVELKAQLRAGLAQLCPQNVRHAGTAAQ